MRHYAITQLICVCLALGACRYYAVSDGPRSSNKEPAYQSNERVRAADAGVETWNLPNGLKIIFREDRELPLVAGALYIRGGSLWSEEENSATVSAMGELLRKGGAGHFSADNLDRELEKLSAFIGSSFGQEFGRLSFSCLASDLERVFDLFGDVLLRPRFEQPRITLWKGQAVEAVKRRVDDPDAIAAVAFTQLLYQDSPYGRIMIEPDIIRVSRAALLQAHANMVHPDGSILAVSGKTEAETLRALVSRVLGGWKRRLEPLGPPPPVTQSAQPGIYFIRQPLAQATVYAGHLGVSRLTADYPAIDAFNSIFGSGGFGSRLMRKVRTEAGLAYSIFGSVNPGLVQGKNLIYFQTKAPAIAQALDQALAELEEMQHTPPSEVEMDETKRSIQNSFVFNFDSAEKIVARQAQFELLGYPPDFDQTYLNKVLALTSRDIEQVAAKRWNLANFIVVVVGNEIAYDSLKRMVQTPDSRMYGFRLREMRFEQKLIL